jgi:hypothetical protein
MTSRKRAVIDVSYQHLSHMVNAKKAHIKTRSCMQVATAYLRSRTQEHKNTRTQEHKNTRTQEHKNTRTHKPTHPLKLLPQNPSPQPHHLSPFPRTASLTNKLCALHLGPSPVGSRLQTSSHPFPFSSPYIRGNCSSKVQIVTLSMPTSSQQ